MQQVKRIANGLITFDGIAATASIDQIEIVESSPGIDRLRLEMIEVKFARDLPPRFTFQTIDTAKVKLVAKPRTVAFVGRVPRRAVASFFALVGVVENQFSFSWAAISSSFRCNAFAPSIGRFASDSSCSRMILVRPANSTLSAGARVS